jgi:hypothetical protein
VIFGGGMCAGIARNVLLDGNKFSGRFYVDINNYLKL